MVPLICGTDLFKSSCLFNSGTPLVSSRLAHSLTVRLLCTGQCQCRDGCLWASPHQHIITRRFTREGPVELWGNIIKQTLLYPASGIRIGFIISCRTPRIRSCRVIRQVAPYARRTDADSTLGFSCLMVRETCSINC